MKSRKVPLGLQVAVRLFADLVILNLALFAGFVARCLALEMVKPNVNEQILRPFLAGSWVLSFLGILTFFLMGFYNQGRAYAGPYKMWFVFQTSTLTFLLFGFVSFFVPLVGLVPRSVLVSSWLLATVILIAARLWAMIWLRLTAAENSIQPNSLRGNVKRVLVIGGAGYVGSSLLPKLLNGGYQVRLLDAFVYGREPIASYQNHPNLEIMDADFRQVDAVVRAMKGVDAVIHLGAIVGDPACELNGELTIEVNLLATRMIAEVAKGNGIERFIFASTCSVYGASHQLLDEHSAVNPVSLYARSKVACERVLLNMKDADFSPVILRFGTIYGFSGRTRFDLVVNLLSAKAVVDKVITVFGSDLWRPFLHVSDAASAVYKALCAPDEALDATVFNVGSDAQNYTLGEVAEIISRMVPGSQIRSFEHNIDRRNYRVDFRRIQRSLDFQPEWTLEHGIQQVIDAIENGRVLDYNQARYSNVKFLSEELGPNCLPVDSGKWVRNLLDTAQFEPVALGVGA